ncbi:Ribbon-helix-helix protein, copG family [Roseovarius lutimaris]|uniref:Ribbon-helix-helix protein, copG family n=1 Tax=Roseovarius lutimaris TaxID=1005928 RepID=A0A1I5GS93_9RHOB|nr:ribbon-helix-helix protein, CopG family [Roseovarius lutimaris]SFO38441.1 Ribbon-helix-helix protein, copG family [Roseovarius lutimaris]
MTKMGRPKVDTQAVMLRLHSDLVKQIDDLRREEEDLPTRPEMIRRIIDDWMEKNIKTEGKI